MSVNVLYVFAFIVLKVQFTFLKWPVVGRTTSVIGRRPPWPYPGYATTVRLGVADIAPAESRKKRIVEKIILYI